MSTPYATKSINFESIILLSFLPTLAFLKAFLIWDFVASSGTSIAPLDVRKSEPRTPNCRV